VVKIAKIVIDPWESTHELLIAFSANWEAVDQRDSAEIGGAEPDADVDERGVSKVLRIAAKVSILTTLRTSLVP
jgi:hypothetical protein